MKLFKKIEDRINRKMTPYMIEAFRNSDTNYINDRFNLFELLIILHWKMTGKFKFEIDNCCECPHSYQERICTPDSFDMEIGIYCSKVEDKNSYNETHKSVVADDAWDVKNWAKVPDWCPLLKNRKTDQ